jgi:hypothetical protein
MTTPAPKRREVRRTHLDAGVVPVERALLARAEAIESRIVTSHNVMLDANPIGAVILLVAGEFRALAEELHWF